MPSCLAQIVENFPVHLYGHTSPMPSAPSPAQPRCRRSVVGMYLCVNAASRDPEWFKLFGIVPMNKHGTFMSYSTSAKLLSVTVAFRNISDVQRLTHSSYVLFKNCLSAHASRHVVDRQQKRPLLKYKAVRAALMWCGSTYKFKFKFVRAYEYGKMHLPTNISQSLAADTIELLPPFKSSHTLLLLSPYVCAK